MLIIIIFLILVFILYELYFVNTEKFQGNSEYDYYFDGNIFLKDSNNSPINIGVGTEPHNDYFLNVDGTLTINGTLQFGETELNYDIAKRINKLPLYSKSNYCLYESVDKTKKQCINEAELGMITGHRKIMFENNNGETLSHLVLQHHGRHHGSQAGRKNSDYPWDSFAEGIQYKDLAFREDEKPTYGKKLHNTLQNKTGTSPTTDNQFQLIPITEPDIRLDDNNSMKIVIFNVKHGRYIEVHSENNIRPKGHRDNTNRFNTVNNDDNDTEKNSLKTFIDSEIVPNGFLKLEEREGKHCIRVKKGDTWYFLNSLGINNQIDFNDTNRTLTIHPMNSSYFTIKQTDGSNYDKDLIKQTVKIKDYTGIRYLSMGTWNGGLFSNYNIRFLTNSSASDKELTLYTEPPTLVEGAEPETIPERKYECRP